MEDKQQPTSEEIMKSFEKEGVFVTSPLNYIVYESGFKSGRESRDEEIERNSEIIAKEMTKIETKLYEAKKQIESMKCCGNCGERGYKTVECWTREEACSDWNPKP